MNAIFTKLTIVLLALLTPALRAQRFAPIVAVKLGAVRNLQERSFKDLPHYSFYPELQLEHKLFGLEHDSLIFFSAIYGSFWDDGIDKASSGCRDCDTYSTSEQTLGMRIGILLAKFPFLPLGFYAGYAQRHISFEYVGGTSINGASGYDFKFKLHTLEAGVLVKPQLFQRWHLVGEVQRLFPLDHHRHLILPSRRWIFKLGLAFALIK